MKMRQKLVTHRALFPGFLKIEEFPLGTHQQMVCQLKTLTKEEFNQCTFTS